MSTQRTRLYPSVAAGAVLHHTWLASVTGAGAENDVVTALIQGARTFVITAAGSEDTVWSLSHQGTVVKYTVLEGDDETDVALAIKNLMNSRFPGQLKASVSTDTIKMVVLDGSDAAPVLVNSDDGTATSVLGAKYTVGNTPTTSTVATGITAAIDAFPDLTASAVSAAMTIGSDSALTSAPTFSVVGTATVGAVTADADDDAVGFGKETVKDI